jgi:hypothetical protein
MMSFIYKRWTVGCGFYVVPGVDGLHHDNNAGLPHGLVLAKKTGD